MSGMEPQHTAAQLPIHVRIADDIRIKIEQGDLPEGTELPTLHQLCDQWNTSISSARSAINLLKQQGLITGGRGKPSAVRRKPRQIVRSSDRHQVEKDLVLTQEQERQRTGVSETDLGASIDDLAFTADFDVIRADDELAEALKVDRDSKVLRRVYELTEPRSGNRVMWSVSYIPYGLVSSNPALLDADNEPWPGGTQHQLYTVGIEIARVDDDVTSSMPTTVEAQLWGMDPGVPMLHVRRISIDTQDRVVEISDADFPGDRTRLHFSTPLKLWETA
jgi:GntR family transcriptional regulator